MDMTSPIRTKSTQKENPKACPTHGVSQPRAPVKRKPLSTISDNVQPPQDEGKTISSKRLKPSSSAACTPTSDDSRLTIPIECPERRDEVNLAWMDMCCALLHKKRSMYAPVAQPSDLSDLLLPTIKHDEVKDPTALSVEVSDPSPPQTSEGEVRDFDVTNAALALHENSQPSSTCCGCKTGCLKLYCRCFLTRGFCTSQCTCASCLNTKDSTQRLSAIAMHLKNNIHAFRVSSSATSVVANGVTKSFDAKLATITKFVPMVPNDQANAIACRCKKSKCSKKYCDCFQAGIACGPRCQCRDCCNNSPKETNTKQIIYAQDTIKVIVTRTPRQAPGTSIPMFRVHL
ncbi:hypothetical protein H310_00183 [Aphanomyces invadans]|uniref:CRC domain-containing protein n=1 Tax=Aphanomyces invadans TaxID=157072 RepID=A0A024UVH6_9STRA|nr:hypothetical protein H310_00183 [Aphanomyces invadans]ETW09668.1 hypothetical protein H310_00183 [Aphanomyces invadans]|eukprot:XP_008861079.1 hypothetical protein H310_00183 [Aphanomyces invadans]